MTASRDTEYGILCHRHKNTMKIQTVIGENGRMQLCKNGNCPSAILVEGGTVYVQGYELSDAERAALQAPAGEGFVRIPLAVLKKIAAHVATA
jgi:hypothetical protein